MIFQKKIMKKGKIFGFEKFFDEIKNANTILISGHIDPDGDCVGTSLAMFHFLKNMGKNPIYYSYHKLPFNYLFLKGTNEVTHKLPINEPDLYIAVDIGSPNRVGDDLYEQLKHRKSKLIVFDHHIVKQDSINFYDTSFIDKNAAATAVILYKMIKESKQQITKEIAESIYTAIMSDTGGLRYNSTNKEAFNTLKDLVDFVEPWKISSNIWENIPLNQLRMLSEVLAEMQVVANGKAAIMETRLEQLKKYNLSSDNIDGFVNFARAINGVELAMRFREIAKNEYKVSMRSKGNIDSSKIASEFGGGGHKNASGFEMKIDNIEMFLKDLIKKIEEMELLNGKKKKNI